MNERHQRAQWGQSQACGAGRAWRTRSLALSTFLCCALGPSLGTRSEAQCLLPSELPDFDLATIGTGPNPAGVGVADFNRDGAADLAVSINGSATVTVYLGDGLGGFSQQLPDLATGPGPQQVTVGDFDLDGNADFGVAVATANRVDVFHGDGAGAFSAASSFAVGRRPLAIKTGDTDGDGFFDLVTQSLDDESVSVLFGPSFSLRRDLSVGPLPVDVAVADWDGDGRSDVASLDQSGNQVTVLLAPASPFDPRVDTWRTAVGSPYAVGDTPFGIAFADLSLDPSGPDGVPDLVVANRGVGSSPGGDSLSILRGLGDGSFAVDQTLLTDVSGPINPVLTDFDLNGGVDIGFPNNGRNLSIEPRMFSILQTNGLGGFEPSLEFPVGAQPDYAATGDFNQDGLPDVAVPNLNSDSVSLLLSRAADFEPPQILLNGPSPLQVQCGSSFEDPGANAIDNCDASLPIVTSGDLVDSVSPGSYQITYDTTDSAGNDAVSVQRLVEVVDTEPPIIALQVTPLGANRFEVTYSANDGCSPALELTAVLEGHGCSEAVSIQSGSEFSFEVADDCEIESDGALEFEAPALVVTVTATDPSGNTASDSRLIDLGPGSDSDSDGHSDSDSDSDRDSDSNSDD